MVRIQKLFMAGVLLFLAACQTTPMVSGPSVAKAETNYTLGSGDVVRVRVFAEEKLSGEYIVTDDGMLPLPLIGNLKVEGWTLAQLRKGAADAYEAGGYLTNPDITAEVIKFRPIFILGEVGRPGQYQFIPGMTVRQAIATANGYTYRAKQGSVLITHWGEGVERNYRVEADTAVAPGDTIRVAERHF